MPSAHDDAENKATRSATPRTGPREGTDDLEFSDFGRDPRYPPAWWILPLLILAGIGFVFLVVRYVL
jgi:hypothetical protein